MLAAALQARARASVAEATVAWLQGWLDGSPPENVWLGTTVEDEARAAERIPHLVAVPAAVRFLSMEPLLERVDLRQHTLARRPLARCGWRVREGGEGLRAGLGG